MALAFPGVRAPLLAVAALACVQAAPSAQQEPLRARLAAMQNQWNCAELLSEASLDSSASSELVRLLADPREDVRQRAASLLGTVKDGRVLANKEYLFSPAGSTLVWVRAARALGGYGGLLLDRTNSEDATIRLEATYSIADGSSESVLMLLDLLNHEDAAVRALAAEGIAWAIWTRPTRFDDTATQRHQRKMDLGACAVLAEGLDEIGQALIDPDVRVRRFAVLTARKLGRRAEPLREVLGQAATDTDPSVRCVAASALASLNETAWPTLKDLASVERAARPLEGLSRAELEDALHNSPEWKLDHDAGLPAEPDRRFEASYELARQHLAGILAAGLAEPPTGPNHRLLDAMQEAAAEHADLLLFSARRHNEEAVASAVALGAFLMPAIEAEVLARGRMPYGWSMFEELIQVILGLGDTCLPLLIEWQTSPDPIARYWAADTLAALGPLAAPAAPFVVSAWRNGDGGFNVPGSDPFWEWNLASVPPFGGPLGGDPNALWSAIGNESVPLLLGCLTDPHARIRRRACKVLARLSDCHWPIELGPLRALLDDEDPTVRLAAARAVLALGGPQDPAALDAQEAIRLGDA